MVGLGMFVGAHVGQPELGGGEMGAVVMGTSSSGDLLGGAVVCMAMGGSDGTASAAAGGSVASCGTDVDAVGGMVPVMP